MDGVGSKVEQWFALDSVTSYLDAHPHVMLFAVTVMVSMLVAALTAIFVMQVSARFARRRITRTIAASEQYKAPDLTVPRPTFHGCHATPKADDRAPYPRFADEDDEEDQSVVVGFADEAAK
ncbi:hypothetical protein [Gordonia sihwensis]|uniref:hypothetical protein n=1 Tax=Gordonia sihwensis TaxID=173559 RepID=UPI0005F04BC5|nr:hypothetical protein [Gordonia sihwensis]KJR10278.1 hypothetical protein UG54_01485 [Gordonia sihwensis]